MNRATIALPIELGPKSRVVATSGRKLEGMRLHSPVMPYHGREKLLIGFAYSNECTHSVLSSIPLMLSIAVIGVTRLV